MKAKQEALVKEREKQLAKKEQSKELQLWVFNPPPPLDFIYLISKHKSLCFFNVNSATSRCFLCLQKAGEAEGEEEEGGAEEENRQFII